MLVVSHLSGGNKNIPCHKHWQRAFVRRWTRPKANKKTRMNQRYWHAECHVTANGYSEFHKPKIHLLHSMRNDFFFVVSVGWVGRHSIQKVQQVYDVLQIWKNILEISELSSLMWCLSFFKYWHVQSSNLYAIISQWMGKFSNFASSLMTYKHVKTFERQRFCVLGTGWQDQISPNACNSL